MKKVLITGAAGTIGLKVIKYLLSEGKYEITAVDFKNGGNHRRLKKYKKRYYSHLITFIFSCG